MLSRSSVLAFWLFIHPNIKVSDYESGKEVFYWYSPTDRCFMYQKPDNKVHNKPMKARGLCSAYMQYVRTLDITFDYRKERDLFDMT